MKTIETAQDFSQYFSNWYTANSTDKILLLTNKKGYDLIRKWFEISKEDIETIITEKDHVLYDTGVSVFSVQLPSFPPFLVDILEVEPKKSKVAYFMFADINQSIISKTK